MTHEIRCVVHYTSYERECAEKSLLHSHYIIPSLSHVFILFHVIHNILSVFPATKKKFIKSEVKVQIDYP